MKLLQQVLFLNLLVVLSYGLKAQSFAPTTDENYLLWEIKSDQLETSSYLFGTIHMIPEEDYVLTESTQIAFDKSSQIFFEIDTEEMTNPMAMMGLMSKMYMNNDTSLSDLLTDEEYSVVSDHFEKVGLPLGFLAKIKPMFLTVLAGEDMEDMSTGSGFGFGGDGIKSYELELTERAKEQKKSIKGLETAEFQMSLFDSIPYSVQAQMLVETIKAEQDSSSTSAGSLDEMVKLYLAQDIVGMHSMINEDSDGGIGGYEDLLLNKRNQNWIPVMEMSMAKSTAFFAVGAGHLGGEQGVIALLRKAGYELVPIK